MNVFTADPAKTVDNLPAVLNNNDDSKHKSTCRVELFNLLDSAEKHLLVRPCIGAVIAEALEQDRYCWVDVIKNTA